MTHHPNGSATDVISSFSNTLSLTNSHTYRTAHRDHGRGVGQRTWEWDALKNKPSFGQSGFRWLGCSFKGEQLSGSAYYFNGCKAPMFWSVWRTSIQAHSGHGSRPAVGQGSSRSGLDVSCNTTSGLLPKSQSNWSVVRESQTWPEKSKSQNFGGRCLILFMSGSSTRSVEFVFLSKCLCSLQTIF